MARERKPLSFAEGVDRASGTLVVDPQRHVDVRNLHLAAGRAEARRGLARALIFPAPWTDLLGVYLVKAAGLAGAVVFDSVSKIVGLYVIDGTGTGIQYVADLWTMPTATPPKITAADQYQQLVIAHDEANYGLRQNTIVYNSTDASVGPLILDLGRTGIPEAVKFRGVAKHLAYMLAWGYGTNQASQRDRGEILRISLPGQPSAFEPEHYFLVGSQGDPIIGGGAAGGVFAVQKVASSFALKGYDRASFGIAPLDPAHGIVSPRLGVAINEEWFFWSLYGPRSSTGGAASDLSLPLDLQGPVPDALASATAVEDGFVYFDDEKGEVCFVFGQWGYVLHLKDGDRRWSYRQFGVGLLNTGLLYVGGSAGAVITAHPEFSLLIAPQPTYAALDGDPTITVTADPVGGPILDEYLEVWVKPQYANGVWRRKVNVPALSGGQTFKVNGFLTTYDIALRYTSGGLAAVGYRNADPATWPAISRSVVTTPGAVTTYILGKWRRLDGVTQGFNLLQKALPGVNYTSPGTNELSTNLAIPFTFRVEKNMNGAGFVALASGVTYAALDTIVRFANGDSLSSAVIRVRCEGPAANSAYNNHAAKIVAPEPPFSVWVDDPPVRTPNNNPDQHDIHWLAPDTIGADTPADGPYDVRGRHTSAPSAPGAYGSIEVRGVGLHIDIGYVVPLVDPSTGGVRVAEAQVRTNVGSGDVSPWVTGTVFEP